MPSLLKGALVEYGSNLLGPLPNVVIFQFNPENLSRAIHIPTRPAAGISRETNQSGEPPVENINLTAHFSAADQLNKDNPLARMFGIGPQLAALEKMARPSGKISGLLQAAVDAIGSMITGNKSNPTQLIPRLAYPRILFIWGLTRVLPVTLKSMTITEQQYDQFLNPIQAEVAIGLAVTPVGKCSNDIIAQGAFQFSEIAKEAQAALNLVATASQIVDLIPFK